MFRKIRSNRAPGVTVMTEVRKEFRVYLDQIRRAGQAMVRAYPKTCFTVMIVLLIASGILCFTIERRHDAPKPIPKLPSSFTTMNNLAHLIRRSFLMKHQIDSLSIKSNLSHQDSLTLEADLDSLSQLNKTFKP